MTATLAAVVAHPDDDTFGCAGTVALHADDAGFRFVLIHVTSGEAGLIADPALATRETLGAVREEEDRRSGLRSAGSRTATSSSATRTTRSRSSRSTGSSGVLPSSSRKNVPTW